MSDRPPAPLPSPTTPTIAADCDDRLVVTTSQLVDAIETSLECSIDEADLETLLVELDRHEYVEWLTVTQSGTVAWDLTDTPDRIAEAIATTVADRVSAWIDGKSRR